ncbi:cache domain-containing protein [Thermodesulfobacteriota bacterium]
MSRLIVDDNAMNANMPDYTSNQVRIARIVLPPVLTVALFCAAIFVLFLPAMESSVMAKKRDMIRELTHTAWNTLNMFHRMELAGELTREQAQVSAVRHLRAQRYGPDNKDYFWIMNMLPRMIMHPYLTHLESQNITADNNIEMNRVLSEMVTVVRSKGAGYVDYVWQWKDNPQRLGEKVSYVQGFDPWQWIVGTGVYLDDIESEVSVLRWKMIKISLMILGVIGVLLTYVIRRGLVGESERRQAAKRVQESEENLRSLMMTVPDPVVVYDIDGRVTYLNKAFTRVFGWELTELKGRRIDFVPEACKSETNAMIQKTIAFGYCANFETQRYMKSGAVIDVSISSARYRDDAGKPLGIVVNLHDISEFNRTKKELEKHQVHLEEMVAERTAALEKSLAEVKILSGMLPICASCKKIRDDRGYWNQLEKYIHEHSQAQFSHSICPDCAKRLYPELNK